MNILDLLIGNKEIVFLVIGLVAFMFMWMFRGEVLSKFKKEYERDILKLENEKVNMLKAYNAEKKERVALKNENFNLQQFHTDEIYKERLKSEKVVDDLKVIHEIEVNKLKADINLLKTKVSKEENANYAVLKSALSGATNVPAELDEDGVLQVDKEILVDSVIAAEDSVESTLRMQESVKQAVEAVDDTIEQLKKPIPGIVSNKKEDMSIE